MEQWLWLAGALVVGIIVGAIVTGIIVGRGRGDEESVRSLKRELDNYRQEVTQHFVETAELVNNLTKSYKAVYDHLERGAYRLVGEETLHKQLEGVRAEPVMLEYIGQRRASGSPTGGGPQGNPAAGGEEGPTAQTTAAQTTADADLSEAADTTAADATAAAGVETSAAADDAAAKETPDTEPERREEV